MSRRTRSNRCVQLLVSPCCKKSNTRAPMTLRSRSQHYTFSLSPGWLSFQLSPLREIGQNNFHLRGHLVSVLPEMMSETEVLAHMTRGQLLSRFPPAGTLLCLYMVHIDSMCIYIYICIICERQDENKHVYTSIYIYIYVCICMCICYLPVTHLDNAKQILQRPLTEWSNISPRKA